MSSNNEVVFWVSLCLLITLLPSLVIMAMVSHVRHMLTRLERSVASLRQAEKPGVRENAGN
jgi:hypothetical protein